MESSPLYQQIIESIRQDIISGVLKPGSQLPTIRKMTEEWHCNTGTILHAYQELARLGLVVSHVGKGTHVVEQVPEQNYTPLRRAALFNRAEAFLLEIMTAGYTPEEIEQSLRVALDRWRVYSNQPEETSDNVLRFIGSHDPAMALIAAHYREMSGGYVLQLSFAGSMGGLIALAENKADLAGCHLWHEYTDTYNVPYVRKVLSGKKVALLTLAHRRMGLILPSGNPLEIKGLSDLTRPGIRFVNRQSGSGTRIWLDVQLRQAGINPANIAGYENEKMTHSEVAQAVLKGQADVGLGVETVALSFGIDFQLLATERYDLVIPAEKWELESIQALKGWLNTSQAKAAINNLGGYDTRETGFVTWIS